MSRTAKVVPVYNQSKLRTSVVKPVNLELPEPHPRQYEFLTSFERIPTCRFLHGAMGSKFGKDLPETELVPSPIYGFQKHGDIKVGDYVFDQRGKPTKVVWVSGTKLNRPCYKLTFADGNTIIADEEHLWLTDTINSRKAYNRINSEFSNEKRLTTKTVATVKTTKEIFETQRVKGKPNHSIRVTQPVEYPEKNLPVDPYLYGLWAGDGSSEGSHYCTADSQLLEAFHEAGFKTRKVGKYDYHVEGLRNVLRPLGVLNNKHVPVDYLFGSIDQRRALLAGLLDTDATVSSKGHSCFDNTNLALADAVEHLCNSLGIITRRAVKYPTINGSREGKRGTYKTCYRVQFTTDQPVFRLKKKLDRIRKVSPRMDCRIITKVEPVETIPMNCIEVESPDHLYLVGKAFIVTHNTYGCSIRLAQEAWTKQGSMNWWVAPTFDQSKMAMALVKKLLPQGFYKDYAADMKIEVIDPSGKVWSTIAFKSGDNPDSLRGHAVDFFIIDEAARIKEESYISVMTTVTQTAGRGITISTPKGRGWFYDVYQKGVKTDEETGEPLYNEENPDPHPEQYSMRLPTWTNPHVSLESIEAFRKNMPEDVFRQEIAAQFMQESAGVFRGIKNCIRGVLEHPQPGHRYIIGVDLARLRDYSVITVLDTDRQHVVCHERFNQLDWNTQYSRIIDCVRRYNNAKVIMDSTGIGDPIVQTIQTSGVFVEPYKIGGNTQKKDLIERLRVAIEKGLVSFPRIPALINELEIYEYETTPNGLVKYSAPNGKHDDCVISLALAVYGSGTGDWMYRYSNVRGI